MNECKALNFGVKCKGPATCGRFCPGHAKRSARLLAEKSGYEFDSDHCEYSSDGETVYIQTDDGIHSIMSGLGSRDQLKELYDFEPKNVCEPTEDEIKEIMNENEKEGSRRPKDTEP
jgi:hypothetical protein